MTGRRFKLVLTIVALDLLLARPNALALGMKIHGTERKLRLVRHDVDVVVVHPVVVVRIVQEFENPLSRMVEGDYSYQLPPGATVDDLGLWVNGERRPARMLERQQAREIYQGIVRKKRDPALVERSASGLYRVRIFPVLPGQRTRIELRYSQLAEARGQGAQRVTLHRAGRVPLRLSVALTAEGGATGAELHGYVRPLRREGQRWTLDKDAAPWPTDKAVWLAYRVDPAISRALVQRGPDEAFVVVETPVLPVKARPKEVAILLDVSRSMAGLWPEAQQLVQALAQALPTKGQTLAIPLSLRAPLVKARDLAAWRPRGGTALVVAYQRALGEGARHLVVISDGFEAGYQAELEHLARLVYDHNRAPNNAPVRISVVKLGDKVGASASLRHLVAVSGGAFASYRESTGGEASSKVKELGHTPEKRRAEIVAELSTPRAPVPSIAGAQSIAVLRRGAGSLILAARIDSKSAGTAGAGTALVLRSEGTTSGSTLRSVAHGPRTLWGAAEIATLERQIRLFGQAEQIRPRIVALSQRLRVASEYTALLVTEKDADYKRPTSGRVWQRRVQQLGAHTPAPLSYHGTPEPHEWALIAIGLALLLWDRRRGLALIG